MSQAAVRLIGATITLKEERMKYLLLIMFGESGQVSPEESDPTLRPTAGRKPPARRRGLAGGFV